jgi:cystinosin
VQALLRKPHHTAAAPAVHGCCHLHHTILTPQVIQNAQRKSVAGLSADYLVYSMLGYAAYTAYTAALHFNPGVQAAYMAAHAGSPPDVQLTDVLFAGHALLVTMYTIYQCVLYGGNSSSGSSDGSSSGSSLETSKVTNLTAAAVFAAVVAYSGHIGSTCGMDDCDAWLPLLYLLGFVKVGTICGKQRGGGASVLLCRCCTAWGLCGQSMCKALV